jgi:hypothetical protein
MRADSVNFRSMRIGSSLFIGLLWVTACSSQQTLASLGGSCNTTDQCQKGLVCYCVRTASPDDEGGDEVIAPGTCENVGFACSDSGPDSASTDSAPTDSSPTDTTSPATTSTDSGTADSQGASSETDSLVGETQ